MWGGLAATAFGEVMVFSWCIKRLLNGEDLAAPNLRDSLHWFAQRLPVLVPEQVN